MGTTFIYLSLHSKIVTPKEILKVTFIRGYFFIIIMNNVILNENDNRLLNLCKIRPYSVNELARLMGISPKNISVRIKKLEKEKLITVQRDGKGRKTKIMTTAAIKRIEKESVQALKDLQKIGEVEISKYSQTILPIKESDTEAEMYSKMRAKNYIFSSNYIDIIARISKEGLKFLKENEQ